MKGPKRFAAWLSAHQHVDRRYGHIYHYHSRSDAHSIALCKVGFDAYASIVVDCDNVLDVKLWTEPPAPQPGDPDYYDAFIQRIARFYTERFTTLPRPPRV